MIDQIEISHHIQKDILKILLTNENARFRDMRPKNVDTNLYSYHLKQLLKNNYIRKIEQNYTLAPKGLIYVDMVNANKLFIRRQPKIVTMLLVQNSSGEILLQKRMKQPFIGTWSLPYGKIHVEDKTIHGAAIREANDKLSIDVKPKHVGDCYIRVSSEETMIASTMAHVFRVGLNNDLENTETVQWVSPRGLSNMYLAPAVDAIIARAFFNDEYFFEEFTIDW